MARRPGNEHRLVVAGNFDFHADSVGGPALTERFSLRIEVPRDFPRTLPTVFEKGGRIPPSGSYHVNGDGSLCLGSPLRLRWLLRSTPTLMSFAEKCIIPYLYAIAHKIATGGELVFGELAHGRTGELADYVELLQLKSAREARLAISYLGMKKRRANKQPCPCSCGHRLGACRFNARLCEFRSLAPRSWFRALLP
jgi:hypothetical protein